MDYGDKLKTAVRYFRRIAPHYQRYQEDMKQYVVEQLLESPDANVQFLVVNFIRESTKGLYDKNSKQKKFQLVSFDRTPNIELPFTDQKYNDIEEFDLINKIHQRLKKKSRKLFELLYYEEHSMTDVCKELKIHAPNLRYARIMLKNEVLKILFALNQSEDVQSPILGAGTLRKLARRMERDSHLLDDTVP